MAWSQLGYKLYCFKQWYSPLTKACITQFQWLWVKYILINMCKKWYPTEGGVGWLSKFFKVHHQYCKNLQVQISAFENSSVQISTFFQRFTFSKSKFSAFSIFCMYHFHVFSMFSLHFFNFAFSLHLLCGDPQKMAEKMRNSAKDAEIWGTGIGTYISA